MKNYLLLTLLCASTAFAEGLLLTPDEVIAQQDDLCVVDVRTAEAFLEKRIPGSVWLSYEDFSETRIGLSGLLPAADTLTELLSSRGVSKDMHIVLYGDNRNAGDLILPTRVFWALEYLGYPHLSILDGGLSRWQAEGKELTSIPPTAPMPPVEVVADSTTRFRLAEKEAVAQALEQQNAVLVDTRPANQYRGDVVVRGTKRRGHIPDAYNIPYSSILSMPHATFKSVGELRELLYPEGITKEIPIIAYCNTGGSSSLIYFAYRLIGHEQVSNYDNGIIEWCNDENLPVVTE